MALNPRERKAVMVVSFFLSLAMAATAASALWWWRQQSQGNGFSFQEIKRTISHPEGQQPPSP